MTPETLSVERGNLVADALAFLVQPSPDLTASKLETIFGPSIDKELCTTNLNMLVDSGQVEETRDYINYLKHKGFKISLQEIGYYMEDACFVAATDILLKTNFNETAESKKLDRLKQGFLLLGAMPEAVSAYAEKYLPLI